MIVGVIIDIVSRRFIIRRGYCLFRRGQYQFAQPRVERIRVGIHM